MEKQLFYIKLAEVVIAVRHEYPYVKAVCKDYITQECGYSFIAEASEEEIAKEQEGGFCQDYCESICIYRDIVRKLPAYDVFFLHASVVEADGSSYAFLAKSGTGKSTHTGLWLSHFGSRARIINGDKPLLRFIGNQLYVYGTPWCGKEQMNINTSSPLKALCFLERGTKNTIRRLGDDEIVARLFHQIIMPQNASEMEPLLGLLDRTVKEVPVWLLSCTISEEAVVTAYEAMSGNHCENTDNERKNIHED